jgi:hypothetical protein
MNEPTRNCSRAGFIFAIAEVLIMANIKRRIASFVAAFAMVGAVTIPSVAKYVSNDLAIVADATINKKVPFWGGVKERTYFRLNPSIHSKVVSTVVRWGKKKSVYFIKKSKDNQGHYWYYSKYDKGWVRDDRIIY